MMVKEFKTTSGVTVRIHDDAYREATPEELERRWQRINDMILTIDRNAQKRSTSARAVR